MFDSMESFLLIIFLIYSVIISVLYFNDYYNGSKYRQDVTDSLARQQTELARREAIVVDKEICFRELTKLKTIQAAALEILKSYTVPTGQSVKTNNNNMETASMASVNSVNSNGTMETMSSVNTNKPANMNMNPMMRPFIESTNETQMQKA